MLLKPSKRLLSPVVAVAALLALTTNSFANDSIYTKLDLEKTCRWDAMTPEQEEEGQGNCATCPGHAGYLIRLCEGDLRQSAFYGLSVPDEIPWNSFSQFNRANTTVEWRLSGGEPVAAIHRFFVENMNDDGAVTPESTGQVLVISTVAHSDGEPSCPVGYVDARANANANELARQVADDIAPGFQCGADRPAFYGTRGPLSGDPTGL